MLSLDLAGGRGRRQECLGGVRVCSSGGVPPAWATLLLHLPPRGRVLDYGSWRALAALWLQAKGPDASVEYASASAGQVATAAAIVCANGAGFPCRPLFPLGGAWDAIVLAAPEQTEALDMLAAQAAACLRPGGQVLIVDRQLRQQALAPHFDQVHELTAGNSWSLVRCRAPILGGAAFPWGRVAVDVCGQKFTLSALPGNFSPQGLDKGSRVLLEQAKIPAGGRVLDLACGYGVIGIVAAKLGAGQVVYLDDCRIALAAASKNIQGEGLAGQLVHSHHPYAAPGKFDCILCNPPYHSDYALAKQFIEFAARRLHDGGWLYLVVKRPNWYTNKLRAVFGGCQTVAAEGYWLLAAQLRPEKQKADRPAGATRKHARRQAKKNGGIDGPNKRISGFA